MSDATELPVVLADPRAVLPTRHHESDAGLDLRCLKGFLLPAGTAVRVDTGLKVAIPEGHMGLILGRSSLAAECLEPLGRVLDHGFSGSVVVVLGNLGFTARRFEAGDRVAQLVLIPISTPTPVAVDALPESERAEGGFGSSGR